MNEKIQYRLVLCGHKALEAGAACLLLMVRGNLAAVTVAHVAIATQTGLLAVFPALGVTFTRYARYLANRWTSAFFLGVCTFFADAAVHSWREPGGYMEAALTALGACIFSIALSFTPMGKRIDGLVEAFSPQRHSQVEDPADVNSQ